MSCGAGCFDVSIFANARTRNAERWQLDTIQPPQVTLVSEATGVTRSQIDRHAEYVVELVIRQTFWANTVQLPDFERQAIRCIASELYRDVLPRLEQLRMAVMSGDKLGALQVCDRIEEATKP